MQIAKKRSFFMSSNLQIPYINGNLNMMYDGEWNTGNSIHSDNPSNIWVDCITKTNRNIETFDGTSGHNHIFGPNYIQFTQYYGGIRLPFQQEIYDALNLNNFTIEVVLQEISQTGTQQANYPTACGFSGGSRGYYWHGQYGHLMGKTFNFRNSYSDNTGLPSGISYTTRTTLAIKGNGSYGYLYVNGIQFKSATSSGTISPTTYTFSAGNYNGKLFCIRFYNRALTDSEITFNSNIDKQRFDNLTS